MTRTWPHMLFVFSLLLVSYPAKAEQTPVERFVESIVTVYIAAEMCKNVPTLHAENYVIVIKNYLHSNFQEGTPYWVLPAVVKTMNNRDNCVYSIQKGIARYQEDSKEFAENYPASPMPPVLNNEMMADDRAYVEIATNEVKNEHVLTPTTLVGTHN